MKHFLASLLSIVFCAGLANAEQILETWDYSNPHAPNLWCKDADAATLRANPDVKTPDGADSLEITVEESKADAIPACIQLRYIYNGGVKAGHRYEVSFLCKSENPGSFQVVASQAGSPWEIFSGVTKTVIPTAEWKPVKIAFTPQKDYAESLTTPRLMFGNYGGKGVIHIGPVTLRELAKLLPFDIGGAEWTLFLGTTPPDSFDSIPQELPGKVKARTVTMRDGVIDLRQLADDFTSKTDCAILYKQFESTEAGRMLIGVSADFWMELYVNGEKVFSSMDGGNVSHLYVRLSKRNSG